MPTVIGFRGVMAVHLTRSRSLRTPAAEGRVQSDPGYQAFLLLRTVFTVAPVLFGLDKFTNLLTHWPKYLAPWIDSLVPGPTGHW